MDDIASALPEDLRPKFLGLVNQLVDLTRQNVTQTRLIESMERDRATSWARLEKLATQVGHLRARAAFYKSDVRCKRDEINRLTTQIARMDRIVRHG